MVLEELLHAAATFPHYYHLDVCYLLTRIEITFRNVYDAATFSSGNLCSDRVIMASSKTHQNGRF